MVAASHARRRSVVFGIIALLAGVVTASPPVTSALGPVSPLDLSFGSTSAVPGTVSTDGKPPFLETVYDAVTDVDGSVVLAARASFDPLNPIDPSRLARYRQDGSLDPAFGAGGLVTVPSIAAGQEPIVDVAIDGSRRLLATRYSQVDRVLPSGSVDLSFAPIEAGAGVPFDSIGGTTPDSIGRVVVWGYSGQQHFVARYTVAGNLDATFAAGSATPGVLPVDFRVMAAPIVISGDRVVVIGFVPGLPQRSLVMRITASGARDSTFGPGIGPGFGAGVAAFDGAPGDETPLHATEDSLGRVVMVGAGVGPTFQDRPAFVVRFDSSGLADSAFAAVSGPTTRKLLSPRTVIAGAGGRLYVIGNLPDTGSGADGAPGVVVLQDSGLPDSGFGWANTVDGVTEVVGLGDLRTGIVQGAALGPDGRVMLWADAASPYLARLRAPGTDDLTPGFNPVSPDRVLDTRVGVGAPAGKVAAGAVLRLQVTGTRRVPVSGVSAVTMNVTVVDPDAAGFATVFPCGGTPPDVSNLNYVRGQAVPNLVTVPVAADGSVCLTSFASTHFLADVAGWFGQTGAGFNPVSPDRVLDTRVGVGAPAGKVAAGAVLRLQVTGTRRVPVSGVSAVTMNVTVVDPDAAGFATVFPCGGTPPDVSNLNYVRGQAVPNLVTVPVAADGSVCLTSFASTHFLADVAGWFGTSQT